MATSVITGSKSGIGLEFCRQLQQRGDTVIATCRNASADLEALGVRVETDVDITNDGSVARFIDRLHGLPIDVLINNAGMMQRVTLDDLNFDSIRQQFEVNTLGALRLTHGLLPQLSRGSKIALITSRMGSIADNTSGGSYGYRLSKVALSMAGKSLAYDLHPQGIAVAILHPGLVRTPMTHFIPQGISPEQSVQGLLSRIDALTLDTSGTFWHANGEVLPW
ncbi:SDR family oxidoreductase [Prochlorothrix hollandica]|uniref:Short-chain dehydrogenase n=1 Tax=Prochlorothrix hollandica PCC 9006 = CALU 1027 TaxID=317619 RepID=A0A0M2PPY9_PROHO|nr:SDR family oxidoreductase [Prochlorothrix hollandica]KKI98635.1 short-chain dehydrogenase [Prochlorothrix hollandica PCC 9006 = CALU 1027]